MTAEDWARAIRFPVLSIHRAARMLIVALGHDEPYGHVLLGAPFVLNHHLCTAARDVLGRAIRWGDSPGHLR